MTMAKAGVLITGASRGLGAALARVLAKQGARVALVARGREALDAEVRAIRAAGGEAHAIVADLGEKDAIHTITGAAAALLGDIDVLVHNGGTLGPAPLPSLTDAACEDLERTLAVNVVGPFRLGKAIVGSMLLRGRGTIVHISSDAAVGAYPGWGLYGASKAAFDQLSRVWAEELAGSGVRLFAVDPGEMDTAMHADAVPEADRATLAQPADVARLIAAMLDDPRIAQGERVSASAYRASR